MSRYIHYGSAKFDKSKFKSIENIQFLISQAEGFGVVKLGLSLVGESFVNLKILTGLT